VRLQYPLVTVTFFLILSFPILLADAASDKIVTINGPIDKVVTAGYCFTPCAMAVLLEDETIVGTGSSISSITAETIATFPIPQIIYLY